MFFFFVPIAQRQSGHFCFSPACLKSHRLSIAQASLALHSAQATLASLKITTLSEQSASKLALRSLIVIFDMLIQKETKRNKMLSLVG